ncbi:L-gulonolactone oxidase-like [Centruroides sculpturatus]|uniref:L-gulonolactone oxidase-like n=1 Tax=Centruroides sculpturatus TaxID=218467 RepID=UPI000C6D7642|nr:L-gulonolactone oxidase-like [Centruroides sculpturatus]
MNMKDIKASGISGVNFTNWSKTFSCVPELLFAPKTNDEIAQILALATDEKKHVRVVGCGHSPSDIACTEDYMISLQHMNKVVEVNHILADEPGISRAKMISKYNRDEQTVIRGAKYGKIAALNGVVCIEEATKVHSLMKESVVWIIQLHPGVASINQTKSALLQLKSWLDNTPNIYVHVPVEVRFVKSDDIYISPAYGRDTCYINIIMYRPYSRSVLYEEYWEAYETIMGSVGGRPHWAKAHKVTAPEFVKMYPCFNTWCSIREKLDPTNMFVNPYLKRIFTF